MNRLGSKYPTLKSQIADKEKERLKGALGECVILPNGWKIPAAHTHPMLNLLCTAILTLLCVVSMKFSGALVWTPLGIGSFVGHRPHDDMVIVDVYFGCSPQHALAVDPDDWEVEPYTTLGLGSRKGSKLSRVGRRHENFSIAKGYFPRSAVVQVTDPELTVPYQARVARILRRIGQKVLEEEEAEKKRLQNELDTANRRLR